MNHGRYLKRACKLPVEERRMAIVLLYLLKDSLMKDNKYRMRAAKGEGCLSPSPVG